MAQTDAQRAITRQKKDAFLKAFAKCGIITSSCRAEINYYADIDRRTILKWRDTDQRFKAEFKEAEQEAIEILEEECLRRAKDGFEKPIYHNGEEVGTEIRYSDNLMVFLLKARNPKKYRENMSIEHTGEDGGPISQINANVKVDINEGNTAEVLSLLESIGAIKSKVVEGDNSEDDKVHSSCSDSETENISVIEST